MSKALKPNNVRKPRGLSVGQNAIYVFGLRVQPVGPGRGELGPTHADDGTLLLLDAVRRHELGRWLRERLSAPRDAERVTDPFAELPRTLLLLQA